MLYYKGNHKWIKYHKNDKILILRDLSLIILLGL